MLKDYEIRTILASADTDRAKAWYAEKIGWQPDLDEPGFLRYAVGASRFNVYETPSAGSARNTVMFWLVDNVPAEVGRLRARGVTFEAYDFGDFRTVDGVMTDPGGNRTAWFKDVDGNIVSLIDAGPDGAANTVGPMIASSDIERSKRWYARVGGYEPVFELEGQVVGYRSAGASFNVYVTDFVGTARNTVAGWGVPDIRAEMADLRERGVTFEEYDFGDARTVDGLLADSDGKTNAWFKDPDGNILGIQEADETGS